MKRPGSSSRLEQLRAAARDLGVPLDAIDVLALSPARVARLLGVSTRTIERELEDGELAATMIRGARRIAVVDLVEYLEARRVLGTRKDETASPAALVLLESFSRAG